nr:peptidase M28 [Thermoleophilaceae bacterium]
MSLFSQAELRDRVERLARIERASASPGEAEAAELIAAELRELGATARVEREDAHGGYWWPIGLLTGAAALAGARSGRLAAGFVGLA